MIYQSVSDIVLDDVFLRLDGFLAQGELLLKIEGLNPAGSIKLKPAVALIEEAEASGALKPGGRVIESSSGNLGIALSAVCASRGYSFTCVADPNTSVRSIALIRALGAQVVVVDRRDVNGGFLQSRIDYVHGRLAADPSLVWPNQYANPSNPRAHYLQTAAAIAKQISAVDYLFVGAGTTGTLMGVADYFREHSPDTKIIAVDTEGSVTFGHPPGPRHIPGLGTSRRPEIFRSGLADEVVMVPERDAVMMCRRLATGWGFAAGGSTGSVLAAAVGMQGRLSRHSRAVAISPDTAERYLDTVYDDAWVLERYGPAALEAAAS